MHLTVIAVLVPQIREQIIDVIQVIPEEWMSKQIVQQIVDVPASKILVEIVEPVAYRREATARVDVRGACRLQASGDSTGGRAFSGTADPGEDC